MTKVFLDTLFVIALINQRDQHHERATLLSEIYAGASLITTDAVLLEIGNALARAFKPQATEVITHLLSSAEVEIVRLDTVLFNRAFTRFREHQDKEWGLVDCISFEVMEDAGIQAALTFDHHFEQAGFQALMREAG